ncbi:cytochrome-c oxidase, subunit VIIa [Auricularia subglabra TFB-10046 SS5]|nr:cytochrome-c oxidase, subunit VIIa [Auricularia subglabra TFB-10046 SS5]
MAVPPITGMLRKKAVRDVSIAIGLGLAGGYGFWYGIHLPLVHKREAFYLKLEKQRAEAAAAEAA